ncbi:hypothetical protein M885DRAFT_569113 [Pelagophyceae sp. CCMP2097]|nr:hypothetical protein M885DRAFT_569113 [Pelagophyceae sp. CCMP2097]
MALNWLFNEIKACEYDGSGTSHFDNLSSNTLAKFIIKLLADSSNETQQFVILIKNVLYLFVFKSRLALVLYHALTQCPHAAACFKVEEKDGGKFTAVPKFGYCITVQITVGLLRPDYTGSAVNAIRDYFGEAEFGGNSGDINDSPGMTQSDFEQKRCSIIEAIRNRSAAETAEKRAARKRETNDKLDREFLARVPARKREAVNELGACVPARKRKADELDAFKRKADELDARKREAVNELGACVPARKRKGVNAKRAARKRKADEKRAALRVLE